MSTNTAVAAASFVIVVLYVPSLQTSPYRIGFDKYHDYREMTDYLTNITNEFSNASSLYSIGESILSAYEI